MTLLGKFVVEMLVRKRELLMNVCCRYLGVKMAMNDDERDRIDSDVKEFIQACMDQLSRISKLITNGSSSDSKSIHASAKYRNTLWSC